MQETDCRNHPMQSWTPRSPAICHLQARGGFGASGKAWQPMVPQLVWGPRGPGAPLSKGGHGCPGSDSKFSLPPPFCSVRPSKDWALATHRGRWPFLSPQLQSWSLPRTPARTPPEVTCYQPSVHPVAWSSRRIKLTLTKVKMPFGFC